MSRFSQFFYPQGGQNYETRSRFGLNASSSGDGTGSYNQITAAAAHSIIQVTGTIYINSTVAARDLVLLVGVGGAGVEVPKVAFPFNLDAAGRVNFSIPVDPVVFAKGVRVSAAMQSPGLSADTATVSISLTELGD